MNLELPREAPDVLVVGAGNAALCAAISAHENGARVLMLEAAPFEERGGNSHFTGGAFRFAFGGVDDLISVLPSLAQENLENVDFGTYTEDEFFDDLFALTQYRSDPDLAEILVRSSRSMPMSSGAASRSSTRRPRFPSCANTGASSV
jgi:tricarballylate dehydrogenase